MGEKLDNFEESKSGIPSYFRQVTSILNHYPLIYRFCGHTFGKISARSLLNYAHAPLYENNCGNNFRASFRSALCTYQCKLRGGGGGGSAGKGRGFDQGAKILVNFPKVGQHTFIKM